MQPGDILVGKVTPKGESPMTPEEKLLRAIFGEKASDVRDTSLKVPPGVTGTVVDVRVFSRRGVDKDERALAIERAEIERLAKDRDDERGDPGAQLLRPPQGPADGQPDRGRRAEGPEDRHQDHRGGAGRLHAGPVAPDRGRRTTSAMADIEALNKQFDEAIEALQARFENKVDKLQRGDELPPGVMKMVKVFVAVKRKLQPGDKMAGRHGNKGVISKIVPIEDMPYLEDGTPVDIVLNPLGVPSPHERRPDPGDPSGLGLRAASAARSASARRGARGGKQEELREAKLKEIYGDRGRYSRTRSRLDDDREVIELAGNLRNGVPIATPVFDGAREDDIVEMLDAGRARRDRVR